MRKAYIQIENIVYVHILELYDKCKALGWPDTDTEHKTVKMGKMLSYRDSGEYKQLTLHRGVKKITVNSLHRIASI